MRGTASQPGADAHNVFAAERQHNVAVGNAHGNHMAADVPRSGTTGFLYASGMANSYSCVLLHIVFSTKNRENLIDRALAPKLYGYLSGACKGVGSPLVIAGGVPDHVHLLVSLGKTITIANLLMEIKKESSKWMKLHSVKRFAWQDGYGVFSIGESQRPVVERYIANQVKRHAKMTFEEELELMLKKYRVLYDPRYMLG